MRFSEEELKELVISAIVIGFSFAWIIRKKPLFFGMNFLQVFIIMMIAVGTAFIFHELAHKFTAQYYGCWAEYRMWETGLIIAFFLAVTVGVVFAAPGAVYISSYYPVSKRDNGIISAAGAITNLALGVIFLILRLGGGAFEILGSVGFFVNTWLALFNMIPVPPLDGSKVLNWNFRVWLTIGLTAFVLYGLF